MQKMTLYFYAAALAGILMLVTFTYSVILVPAWNWVSTIPAAVSKTTSGWFSAKPATNPPAKNQPPNSPRTDAHVMTSEKPPKPINCALVIKQIKSGKTVTLPPECEQTYEAVRQNEQAEQQRQSEQQKLKEEARQRELDRQTQERQTEQQIAFEREREQQRLQEHERQRQIAEQERAANFERQRQRQESDDLRRREEREEADRRQAQREASQREQQRQRDVQKRNDALIRLGNDIRNKIFKKNR